MEDDYNMNAILEISVVLTLAVLAMAWIAST